MENNVQMSPAEMAYHAFKEQDVVSLTESAIISTIGDVKKVEFLKKMLVKLNGNAIFDITAIEIKNHTAKFFDSNLSLMSLDLTNGYIEIDETDEFYTVKFIEYSQAVKENNLAAGYAYPMFSVALKEKERITMQGVSKVWIAEISVTPTVFDEPFLVKMVTGDYNSIAMYLSKYLKDLETIKDLFRSLADTTEKKYIYRPDALFEVMHMDKAGIACKIVPVYEFENELKDDNETAIDYQVLASEPYIVVTAEDVVIIGDKAVRDGKVIGTAADYVKVFSTLDTVTKSEVYKLKEAHFDLQKFVEPIQNPNVTDEVYESATKAADKLRAIATALIAELDSYNLGNGSVFRLFRGSVLSLDKTELENAVIFANKFQDLLESAKVTPLFPDIEIPAAENTEA